MADLDFRDIPPVADGELDEVAESLAPFCPRVLLTGAGFSKDWGGYLTSELWSVIVSDPAIRAQKELDRILHDDLNFEVVLARIEHTEYSDFSEEDRRVLRTAIDRAFEMQQERINGSLWSGPGLGTIERIIDAFGAQQSTTCLFTLNQDLLMEHYAAGREPFPRLLVPGASFDPADVTVNDFFPDDFRAIKGKRSYIKLHGSINWTTGLNEPVKVLGGAKQEAIEQFAILRMNNKIFQQALTQLDARLLVIGYGFGDPHINDCIAQGWSSGLKIWIVDPRDPETIQQRMRGSNVSGLIWRAVVGHSSSTKELFDTDRTEYRLFSDRFWNGR